MSENPKGGPRPLSELAGDLVDVWARENGEPPYRVERRQARLIVIGALRLEMGAMLTSAQEEAALDYAEAEGIEIEDARALQIGSSFNLRTTVNGVFVDEKDWRDVKARIAALENFSAEDHDCRATYVLQKQLADSSRKAAVQLHERVSALEGDSDFSGTTVRAALSHLAGRVDDFEARYGRHGHWAPGETPDDDPPEPVDPLASVEGE